MVFGEWLHMDLSRRKRYDIYKELENLATKMNYSIDSIIVEGSHDKKTLRALGYKKAILVGSKISLIKLANFTAKRFTKMVVLTDFDEEGEIRARKLSRLLANRNIEVKEFYRSRFRKLLKTSKLSTIEGIYRLKLELFKHKK